MVQLLHREHCEASLATNVRRQKQRNEEMKFKLRKGGSAK